MVFTRGLAGDVPSAGPSVYTPRTGAGYSAWLDMPQSTALTVATAYRCVRLLSGSVANLPVQVLTRKGDIFTPDTGDRLQYLLGIQPNPTESAYDFWERAVENLLLDGNAYIVPVYSPTQGIERLVLCNRGTVSHDTLADRYLVNDPENHLEGSYGEADMLHIKYFAQGKRGLSVISHARQALGIASTGDQETLARFRSGGNVRGLVGNDRSRVGFGEYSDTELENTAADIDSQFAQGRNIIGLPGSVDFRQLSMSSADMQFLESRKFTVREICRFFGVHPSFVFDDTSNNYKSAEMANVAFLSNTLNPLLRKFESEMQRKFTSPGMAYRRRYQFDRRGLYACDLDSRVRYQERTIAAGLYSVNDWRREENRPPVKGGDAVYVSANLRTLGEMSETPAPTPANDQQRHLERMENNQPPKDIHRRVYAPCTVHVRADEGEDGNSRTIEGYAVLFNTLSEPLYSSEYSEAREEILPEAISRDFLNRQQILMTLYHDDNRLLARSNEGNGSLTYEVDEKGVKFRFEAPHTADGDTALELVRRGDISGCSFAFSTRYYDENFVERVAVNGNDTNGKRMITYRVRRMTGIYDFTLTPRPAYSATSVEARDLRALMEAEDKPEAPDTDKRAKQVEALRRAAKR